MNAVARFEESSLVRYEAMCIAIAECHRVDEAKNIHDKARALEVYAKQSQNTDAERRACEIRIRAARRFGELLAELDRAEGPREGKAGPGRKNMSRSGTCFSERSSSSGDAKRDEKVTLMPRKSDYAKALDDTGISRQTAHRYQQLAAVPSGTFEEALADEATVPSAAGIVRRIMDPVPQIDDVALRVWGTAGDFKRHRDHLTDPSDLLRKMTEEMQEDMGYLAPMMANYWNRFAEVVK